ncbi:MAG: hypothetical protein Q7T51_03290 [Candidatus Moranbacteria bacterium]|nr:hypothetical protein [Candidatus Moranbacteria bacterium]
MTETKQPPTDAVEEEGIALDPAASKLAFDLVMQANGGPTSPSDLNREPFPPGIS